MLCELPLMPDSFRLQTAAIMRIMKGGVRLERYISKIQSRRSFAVNNATRYGRRYCVWNCDRDIRASSMPSTALSA